MRNHAGIGRGKPEVALKAEQIALENILQKLRLITAIVQNDCFESVDVNEWLKICPQSIRGFNEWDYSAVPEHLRKQTLEFWKNGSRTVKRHHGLEQRIEATIGLVKVRLTALKRVPSRIERMASLRRQAAEALALRDIAMLELKAERDSNQIRYSSLVSEVKRAQRSETEALAALQKIEQQCDALRREIMQYQASSKVPAKKVLLLPSRGPK